MKNNLSLIYIFCVLLSACAELQPYSGADPFLPIESGAMPLHLAAAKGDSDEVRKLISEGSPVDLRTNVKKATPLHFAAWQGQYHTAKLLIEHGADVNATTNWGGTPLMYASGSERGSCLTSPCSVSPGLSEGHLTVVALLIENGADVNNTGKYGSTALGSAAICNAVDVAQLLIKHGADLDVRGNQYTALEMASSRGPDVAILMIKSGAKVNTWDRYTKTTPLHSAVQCSHQELIKVLLQHGANPNAKDQFGKTPYD